MGIGIDTLYDATNKYKLNRTFSSGAQKLLRPWKNCKSSYISEDLMTNSHS